MTVRLSSKGLDYILKVQCKGVIKQAADQVAANVNDLKIGVGDVDGGPREQPIPVKVNTGTSDRARANVTLAHPAGMAVQAKHGALTSAAAQAGLQVRSSS